LKQQKQRQETKASISATFIISLILPLFVKKGTLIENNAGWDCGINIILCLKKGKEIKMNIYVGNLSGEVTENDLRQAFESFGQVESVNLLKDRISGESRGFGFVMMPSASEAQTAITGLNSRDLKGQNMNVSEAHPRMGVRRSGGRGGYGGSRRNSGRGSYGGGRGGGRRY
jgi:RNA recognition motif-containing protein